MSGSELETEKTSTPKVGNVINERLKQKLDWI